MLRPMCEAIRSAAADSECLGSGSTGKTLLRVCIGRLSVVAGSGHVRWLRQLAAVCWAEVVSTTTSEADRALGPMLPSWAREHWPFCVVRDARQTALPDHRGLPLIGLGRRTGGSRRHLHTPLRLTDDGNCINLTLGHVHGCLSFKSQVSGSNAPSPRLPPNAAGSSCPCAVVCLQAPR